MTPDEQIQNATRLAAKTPFHEIPALYAKLERRGQLPPEVKNSWMQVWEKDNAVYQKKLADARARHAQEQATQQAEHRRMLASMTPAQRAAYELQLQQLALQQEANELQRQGNANANLNAILQRSQSTIQANNQILSDLATRYRQPPVVPAPYVAPQFYPQRSW